LLRAVGYSGASRHTYPAGTGGQLAANTKGWNMGTAYRVRDETTWRELDGEMVILDTVESVYYSLAGIGAMLWPMLVEGTTRDSLVNHVTSTFSDVSLNEARTDVDDFIESCIGNSLIEDSAR
jgi:hypothetical protein